jgi:predicted flavoprotein YhiN
LRRCANIEGIKAALIHEFATPAQLENPAALATLIKSVPVPLIATRPIDEAISTAGGVLLEELNDVLMLVKQPGVFSAGEMLDWEAPTGGYLLTACLASGALAGRGVLSYLGRQETIL